MHVIWNLLRTELSAHATMLRSFVVVAAIISTANLVMGGATPAIAVCVLTVAFLPSALFAQDERAHLDTMYSVLPVTRAQFVVARYLFVALIVAIQLLLFFSLGYARTGMYAYGATMILMFAFGLLTQKLPDLAATIIRWAGSPWAGAAGPGAAAAVLALSAMSSVRLYRRRSL